MSLDPRAALAAQQRPMPKQTARTALVAGCTGRLGEALLNAVLGSSAYERVYASTRMPLESSLRKLAAADVRHPLPPVDDVYCLIAGSEHGMSGASYFGRDDAFAEYPAEQIATLAESARASGARRFALVSPLEVYLQSSVFADALIDTAEQAVHGAGFDAIVILRPTAGERSGKGGSIAERFMRWWFQQLAHMIPTTLLPVRSTRVAAAAVETLTALHSGRRVVTAQELQAR